MADAEHADPLILSLNGGSSSIRFACFLLPQAATPTGSPVTTRLVRVLHGQIKRIGRSGTTLTYGGDSGAEPRSQPLPSADYPSAVAFLLRWLGTRPESARIAAIGHRIVHGASRSEPARITAELIADLQRSVPLCPEHLPGELALIDAFVTNYPNLPQVACFDTAFHHDLPRVAQWLAIPRRYAASGVRRYGFHGLSCEYLLAELGRIAGSTTAHGRVILAHLGNGSSLTAVHNGRSIETSMGFTPGSGLPMSTRSGDIDPGLAGYLARSEHMDAAAFDRMVNTQSGLLGISETSGDMHDLLLAEATDPRALEAIDVFCYQVRKMIGALVAVLGGLDTLVFAGGIGENAPVIRSRICSGLEFLGIHLSAQLNEQGESLISTANSRVSVRLIRTDEEQVIASGVSRMLDING